MAQRLGTTVDHSGEGWATAFAAALTIALSIQDDDVLVVLTVEDARATLLAVSGFPIQSFLLGLLDEAPPTSIGIGLPDELAPFDGALHIFAHPNDIEPTVRAELNIESIIRGGKQT